MAEEKNCLRCGADLPLDAPEGLCPRCLLAAGLQAYGSEEARSTAVPDTAPFAGFVPPEPSALAEQFPQLEIIALLGQGGMGAVYKARQKQLDRLVALKILPPEVGITAAFAERFSREARSLARLSHPRIVSVYDFGQTENGLYYFLMEFVDGTDLRHVLQAGRLGPDEALAIVPQICEALQYAHGEGFVHRDIKPENILLDKRGQVKIADFGLARLLDRPSAVYTLTAPGHRMGTPHYMAPEQMEHPHEVDQRADIYSLGVVFYEMLTGQLPLGQFDPPSRKVHIDVRLDQVVLKALEYEPQRRYQQASEVKTDLESIAGSSGIPRSHPISVSQRFSRPAIVGACLAPLALLAAMPPVLNAVIYLFRFYKGPGAGFSAGDGMLLILALVGFGAPFATTILGHAAISHIRGSGGRIRGMGLAVFDGLLFPLLALDAGILLILAVAAAFVRVPKIVPLPIMAIGTVLALPVSMVVDFIIVRWFWRRVNAGRPVPTSPTARARQAPDQPRLSRAAVVGACWAPWVLLLVVPAIGYFSLTEGEQFNNLVLMIITVVAALLVALGLAPLFGTTILGIVAVTHIRHSGGRLYGTGLALFDALLFPLLVLDILIVGFAASNFVQSPLGRDYGPYALIPALLACPVLDFLAVRWAWRKATTDFGRSQGTGAGTDADSSGATTNQSKATSVRVSQE